MNLAPVLRLGANPMGKVKWAGPIVYGDVSPKPTRFLSSALRHCIISIIALGTFDLAEIGDSGPATITSGSVVYFRDFSPIVYRASRGRGIMFCVCQN